MEKKLSLELSLENGKMLSFSISKIKNITAEDVKDIVKNFNYNDIFAKDDVKVKEIKSASIISVTKDSISLA